MLILGSLPGNRSLAVQQYYGNPRNQFWALVEAVWDVPLVSLPYEQRLAAVADTGIGLWDVYASAHRASSLDSDIRGAVTNRLEETLGGLPHCHTIACNGAQAAKSVMAQLGGKRWNIIALPSSSPAYTLPFQTKLNIWWQLKQFL